jgi:UDP-N-acetylglucosamine--N-acetylmuramyl-(pentapeptide) pyrophosphoryl-undecaprenol N-acetylglucosamine transferase
MNNLKFIFAGGGTGGHLFPAIAISDELKMLIPQSEIIFVGTKNKIESKVVPQYGYRFETIWISGFSRKLNLNNLLFPIKVMISLLQSFLILNKYKPNVVIGTGGYVSGPILWSAIFLKKPTVLQDHNSYPGMTTKFLAKKADEVHLAFEDSKKYFKRKDNLFVSGFPIRKEFKRVDRKIALEYFQLDELKKIIFVTGGSQGAKSINSAMLGIVENLSNNNFQVIWQTGSTQYHDIFEQCKDFSKGIKIYEFIKDMHYAYSVCDLAIARAGASTIGEIISLQVPAILVPFPLAAEDHQTMNAMSLVNHTAGIILKDKELPEKLLKTIMHIFEDQEYLILIKENLKKIAKPETAKIIAQRIVDLVSKTKR